MPAGDYSINVKVDGVTIPESNHCSADKNKCIFKVRILFSANNAARRFLQLHQFNSPFQFFTVATILVTNDFLT